MTKTHDYLDVKSFEWIGPTLLVTGAFASQNQAAISVALNVISNYLTDWFKGTPEKNTAKLQIIVEKTKSKQFVKIDYEGPPEGIKNLPPIIFDTSNE